MDRKVRTPNDFAALAAVAARLHDFALIYEQAAKPFDWTFARRDLARLMRRMATLPARSTAA